jgi:hypothetical protein
MEPPPASLEAMVRSGPGSAADAEHVSAWAWVSLLIAVGAAVTVYFMMSHH